MKKTFLKTLTVASVLALISPITANAAARIEADKTDLSVGNSLEVTISTDVAVELMQFDLHFDKTKYSYQGMETDLSVPGSNLIDDKSIVRVSAFDENGNKTNNVKLKFKAEQGGTAEGFYIDSKRTIDLGEGSNKDTFDNADAMKIASIKITDNSGNTKEEVVEDGENDYVTEDGQKIKTLPDTNANKAIGKFEELGKIGKAIPYALSDSDDTVTLTDIKNEFGQSVTSTDIASDTDIAKTGDKVQINGEDYTIIIYGDINKDGKVTTSDLLKLTKEVATLNAGPTLPEAEAADVQNNGIVEKADINAIHEFILESGIIDNNPTGTIIDKNPVKIIVDADIEIPSTSIKRTGYAFSEIHVATINAMNGATLTEEILSQALTVPANAVAGARVTYIVAEDGKSAKMMLKTTSTGTYKIKPIISGADVDGTIEKDEIEVTVTENKAVTAIKFFDGANEITNKQIELESLGTKTLTVKFYYTAYDATGKAVETPIIDPVTGKDVVYTNIIGGQKAALKAETALYDGANPVSTDTQEIKEVRVFANSVTADTTATIKVEAKNADYDGIDPKTETLTVIVKKSAIKAGLLIDGKTPANGMINLYTEDYVGTTPENVYDIDGSGKKYTVLPITYGDTTQILDKNIIANDSFDDGPVTTEQDVLGNVIVADDDSDFTCNSIAVKRLCAYTNSNGKIAYSEGNPGAKCDAIGITALDEGAAKVFVKYYEASGTAKTIELNVSVNPVTPTADVPEDPDYVAPARTRKKVEPAVTSEENKDNKTKTNNVTGNTTGNTSASEKENETQANKGASTSGSETTPSEGTEAIQKPETPAAPEAPTTPVESVTPDANTPAEE